MLFNLFYKASITITPNVYNKNFKRLISPCKHIYKVISKLNSRLDLKNTPGPSKKKILFQEYKKSNIMKDHNIYICDLLIHLE